MSPEWPEPRKRRPGPEEKRKEERYQTDLRAKFRKIDKNNLAKSDLTYHEGWIRDMSMSGMRIESEVFLSLGQTLEIFVDDKVSGESFFGIVEAVRSRKEVDYYDIGVRIIEKEKL